MASQELFKKLATYLVQVHQGKVRNSYNLLRKVAGLPSRLSVATDRVSIFDFVLGFEIPEKGEVLTLMNILWRLFLYKKAPFIEQDLLAYGETIDKVLPEELRGNAELQKRAVVVEDLDMLLVEAIVRRYLTGTGWDAYQQTGAVCGHLLPPGLRNGSKLEQAIFTPTTKAPPGEHDQHLDYREVEKEFGPELETLALLIFDLIAVHAQETYGLLWADMKSEFGRHKDRKKGGYVLGDEAATADSSRIWRESDYKRQFPESIPSGIDKQPLRQWGKTHGINDIKCFDPKKPDDVARVKLIMPPRQVIDDTRDLYLSLPKLMTGLTLKQAQIDIMGVRG